MGLLVLLPSVAMAFEHPLIENLAGQWVLTGDIAGQSVTHDITAEWVLGHHYLQLHELSREKEADGSAVYEAIIYIGWNAPNEQFACQWLDITGGWGLDCSAIGHGAATDGVIPFVFVTGSDTAIDNTFAYHESTDHWTWKIVNVRGDERSIFAEVRLDRP